MVVPLDAAAQQLTAPPTSARRRTGLVTADQILSSASNLLVVLLAAHALSPSNFGRFSLIMLIYTFALGPTRAVVSIPVLIYPEDADHRPWAVLGSALVLATWGGGIALLAGGALVAAGSLMGPATLALAALLPLLQLQDVARYLAIARATPMRAIVLDLIWLVLMVGTYAFTWRRDQGSLLSFILVWGGSGAAAALWIVAQYALPRRGDVSLTWLRSRWSFSWRSLVANVANTGGALVGAAVVVLVSSPVAVAAVRASLLLGRPSATVQAAVSAATAAEVAREDADDVALRRHQRKAMSISGLVALANLIALLLIPDWLGEKLLGNVWPLITPLLLAVGLSVVAMAAQSGVRAVLLGRHQIQITMVADIAGATLLIGSMVIGAAVADARGAVWAVVVGQALTAACWWVAFGRYLRRDRRPVRGRHRARPRLA